MKSITKNLPLRVILLTPIFFVTVLTFTAISYISIKGSLKSAEFAIYQLFEEVFSSTKHHIEDLLRVPILLNELNNNSIKNGYLKINDKINREIYFFTKLSYFQDVSYTFIGTPDGQFYGARRNLKGDIEHVVRNNSTGGASHYFKVKPDGTSGELVEIFPQFDPRVRPWYKAAAQAGKQVWSPVYKHFVMPSLAITASSPVYDNNNRLIGVFGTDLLLNNINKFLKDLKIGQHGWAYIIDTNGYLIATSMDDTLFVTQDKEIKRIHITQTSNPKIKESSSSVIGINSPTIKEIKIKGELHYVHTDFIKDDYGINWQVVICIPKADFLQPTYNAIRQTIVLSLIIMVILSIAAIYVSSIIINPLVRLAQTTH
ncbi:MAG: cache domain-containing protein, partial [Thermodesulfovibrionales bacterium]